jgi:hypothetical protein
MLRYAVLLYSCLLTMAACASRQITRPQESTSASMSREQATQLLIHEGYRDITHLHRNGEDWIATANKHGKTTTVDIDNTGSINPVPPQR